MAIAIASSIWDRPTPPDLAIIGEVGLKTFQFLADEANDPAQIWTSPHGLLCLDVLQVLVVAVGKAGLIGAEHVKEGAVVIDVGINRVTLPDGRVVYGGSPGDGGPGDTEDQGARSITAKPPAQTPATKKP